MVLFSEQLSVINGCAFAIVLAGIYPFLQTPVIKDSIEQCLAETPDVMVLEFMVLDVMV